MRNVKQPVVYSFAPRMWLRRARVFATIAALAAMLATSATTGATLDYAGTHYDIGGTFFPGGGPLGTPSVPYVVVPWRTASEANTLDADGDDYYGTAGYAMFATTSTYPNANEFGGQALPPEGDILFPNLIDLPDFVTESAVMATRLVGGYNYSLIDDPQITAWFRDWDYRKNDPLFPIDGQAPYVKLGIIDGSDVDGNDPVEEPTARWAFIVGENVPESFRLGVMTDGTDNANFAPDEVFLQQYNTEIVASSGSLVRNRFVDMHFFDITGAQAGDQFTVAVKAVDGSLSFGNAGVAGFSFDLLVEQPLVVGDYNNDGFVDAADYTVWRDTQGQTGPGLAADGNGDEMIDEADYNLWKTNFGQPASAAGSALDSTSVPEPSALLLLAMALTSLFAVRRKG